MCCAPKVRAGAPQIRKQPAALQRRLWQRALLPRRPQADLSKPAGGPPHPNGPSAEQYLRSRALHILRLDSGLTVAPPPPPSTAHIKSTPILGPPAATLIGCSHHKPTTELCLQSDLERIQWDQVMAASQGLVSQSHNTFNYNDFIKK